MTGFEPPGAVGVGAYNPAAPEEVRKEVVQVMEEIKFGNINPAAVQ